VRRKLVTGGIGVFAIAMVVLAIVSWSTNDEDRVRGSVEKFAAAIESRDYKTVCEDLLADDLLDKLQRGQIPCERFFQGTAGQVQDPRLKIQNVVVVDDRARAAIVTEAKGQTPSSDVLSLQKQDGSWRISELNQTATTETTGTSANAPTPESSGVVTTPSQIKGDLTPDPSALPDDARIQDKSGKGKTPAEKRRDARIRELQRRALRVQGDRGE
jgi:ketosteroid isomerase-like protein